MNMAATPLIQRSTAAPGFSPRSSLDLSALFCQAFDAFCPNWVKMTRHPLSQLVKIKLLIHLAEFGTFNAIDWL